MLTAVGISGSPRATSKSRLLVERVLDHLGRGGAQVQLVDLAVLPADALLGRDTDSRVAAALDAAAQAQIVVAGTPVYRATYTGLLKAFFDLFPRDALAGAVGVPVVTGAGPEHALAVDHGLRPLFASLGARTIAAAIYATDAQFPNGSPEPALITAIERAAREAEEIAHRASLS
ncbi:MAG TPA: NAD(P)H-dependent oxidoreductase [Gemmatimonadales bacterium]|nr:NAD(P)H-dependent oxidoreductase [Gemmatimonadales bacterium]